MPLKVDTSHPLFARAEELDRELRMLVKRRRQDKAQIADLLARIKLEQLYKVYHFPDVASYARARGVSMSSRQARDLIKIVDKLEALPELARTFRAGECDWTKVRAAVTAATPETDGRWAKDVCEKSKRVLEDQAASERRDPKPRLVDLHYRVTREEREIIEAALRAKRAEADRKLTNGQALARVCDTNLAVGKREDDSPQGRAAPRRCEECEKRATEAYDRPVPASERSGTAALARTQVLGAPRMSPRAAKTAPSIALMVHARDAGCCRVPGCPSTGFLAQVHVDDQSAKHDPAHMLLLCTSHQESLHQGSLKISGAHPSFRFFLADWTELVRLRSGEVRDAG